jgi:rsbT co-antagonist protein RsbR
MTTPTSSKIAELITTNQKDMLEEWLGLQKAAITARIDLLSETDLRREAAEFMVLLVTACRSASLSDISGAPWEAVRGFLGDLSRSRALAGFSPSETVTFVFSFKQPLFMRLRQELGSNAAALADEMWTATVLLDKLGLYTAEVFQQSREEIIKQQQIEMLELSTPVVKIWDGILAVPLIGTMDSERTQMIMENLLQTIVDTGSGVAIVDITGVPTVDTLVAQHLLKTVTAAKLMGAQCIICGIRPQIAQAMVHLGVAFGDVVTKATLADALAHAFRQIGCSVTKQAARA